MTKLNDNQIKLIASFNKASFAIEAAAGTLRTRTIKMFNQLDLDQSVNAIQALRDSHMNKAELKPGQQVPSFEATRKCINRILANKDTAIEWNAKHDLTLKTDKATGIVSFTAKVVAPPKSPDNTAPANIEAVAEQSKIVSEKAGASFDDRMSALLLVASDLDLNAEDIITEYFDGLTTTAKGDCLKTLSAMVKPSVKPVAAKKAVNQ